MNESMRARYEVDGNLSKDSVLDALKSAGKDAGTEFLKDTGKKIWNNYGKKIWNKVKSKLPFP